MGMGMMEVREVPLEMRIEALKLHNAKLLADILANDARIFAFEAAVTTGGDPEKVAELLAIFTSIVVDTLMTVTEGDTTPASIDERTKVYYSKIIEQLGKTIELQKDLQAKSDSIIAKAKGGQ